MSDISFPSTPRVATATSAKRDTVALGTALTLKCNRSTQGVCAELTIICPVGAVKRQM